MAQLKATTISGTLSVTGATTLNSSLKVNSSITSTGAIISGSRMYLPNATGLRGMQASATSATTDTSETIAWVNADNRVILGDATNSGRTEVRSPGYTVLMCNGGTNYDGTYALRWYYYDSGSCCILNPSTNGTARLGSSSYKWSQLYASTSTIATSDRNLKRNIQKLDDRYLKLFDLIEPVSFQFIDGKRIHTGFISQDVETAMEQVGLKAEDLAFFCKDIKTTIKNEEEVPDLDENGNIQYLYSLRYEEYIAIMAEKVKRQNEKINNLESRLEILENLLEIN